MATNNQEKVKLTYHHCSIACSKITIGENRSWLARTAREVKGGLATDDLFALQESIDRVNVLDPLVVLLEDEESNPVNSETLDIENHKVEIISGFRRLIALRRHLADKNSKQR